MKILKPHIILFFLIGMASLFTACVKDEEGYSEYIQNYLDQLAIADTIPVDLDVPCITPDNTINYYTYDYNFTQTECSDNGSYGYEVKAYNTTQHVYLYLTFKNRPVAGKYATDHSNYAPNEDDRVVMEYDTNTEDFLALDDDTVYVEKLSGGIYVFSFCNVQIDAGWGGYYASGNFDMQLTGCE